MSDPVPSLALSASPPRPRRRALTGVAAVALLAAVGTAVWWFGYARSVEHTDNAYVQAPVVQVSSQVAGTVVAILADDTDFVRSGQTLVRLDPTDARLALSQAEAQLGQAVREVRQLFGGNAALQSQVAARQADLARARSELARASDDAQRRTSLNASGMVGQEELNHARTLVETARSNVAAAEAAVQVAREQLAANLTLTDGTTLAAHPRVEQAAARFREAWIAWKRTETPAPLDGHVARRSVQVGQRLSAGQALLSLVALREAWVDANFKESQIERMRIGQPVALWADVYGKSVEYHGTVAGLAAGTGAAFSLLPAQNATGNWIKVVQRVPVRITLDPKELEAHPLRVGLSMQVAVDVSRQDGAVLAKEPRAAAVTSTDVYDRLGSEAQTEAHRVMAVQAAQRALTGH